MRDGDVDVDAVSLRPRCVHLLEPDRRADARRVDDAGVPGPLIHVAEHGQPERPDSRDVERVDGHLAGLDGERFARQLGRGSQIRDRPGQCEVGVRDDAPGGVRRQGHVDPVGVPDVEVGMMIGHLGGRCHVECEPRRRVERAGAERRLQPAQQEAPVGKIVVSVELGRRDPSDDPGTIRRVVKP